MDAQQVKELLSERDISDLLSELGGYPRTVGKLIYSKTVCHGGNRHKLIYFPENYQFTCFTGCGCSYDVFSLISKVFGIDFASAFKYITGKFGINTNGSFLSGDRLDLSFINKFKKHEPQYILNEIDSNLLNSFYQLYHENWINDGISIEAMKKHNILYSIKDNKIIIPHFDIDGRLLGIRGRALNEDEVEAGRKYMPIFHKGEVRKHPTGGNIYGLEVSKEDIRQQKSIILFESEKGPLQLRTMRPDMAIGGGISGSSLSFEQIKIIQKLGVENVCLALDKEFEKNGTQEELFYKQKIKSGFIDKLLPYFRVSVIWDREGLLGLKDSPTDKGIEVFNNLWENKILIG